MTRSLRVAAERRTSRRVWIACLVLLLSVPAQAVDWNDLAGSETVTITTTDADGTPRVTTIWLVVVGGFPYVRTGSTRWGANAQRNPDVTLHAGGRDFLLRAVSISDPDLREQLQQAFHDKYGWQDRVAGLMHGSGPTLFRLDPRPGS